MKFKMTLGWKVWCFAVLLFTAFMSLSVLSSSLSGTQLKLTPGQEVQWQVWRPFDSEITSLKLRYRRSVSNEETDKDFAYCNRSDETGDFICKGKSVVLAVSLNNSPICLLKAVDDGFAYNTESVWRNLSETENCIELAEKSGKNIWNVKVESVNPMVINKIVMIEAEAPLGFKTLYGSAYEWLILSIFWPIWVGLLTLWAVVLWCINRRKRRV